MTRREWFVWLLGVGALIVVLWLVSDYAEPIVITEVEINETIRVLPLEIVIPDEEREQVLKDRVAELEALVERLSVPGGIPMGTLLGEFCITAYCSDTCCTDQWGLNRPRHGGRDVVVTASGAFAEINLTVAADTGILPFGSVVYIEGLGIRIVQDRGGGVRGNHLDLYKASHAEALQWGNQFRKVWIIYEPTNPETDE
jgi:3D (Asp-Asp-Asp) domain-containing protein